MRLLFPLQKIHPQLTQAPKQQLFYKAKLKILLQMTQITIQVSTILAVQQKLLGLMTQVSKYQRSYKAQRKTLILRIPPLLQPNLLQCKQKTKQQRILAFSILLLQKTVQNQLLPFQTQVPSRALLGNLLQSHLRLLQPSLLQLSLIQVLPKI